MLYSGAALAARAVDGPVRPGEQRATVVRVARPLPVALADETCEHLRRNGGSGRGADLAAQRLDLARAGEALLDQAAGLVDK